ncbi:hypothetical protein BGZ57DRAFT_595671 [Hyaloscypha finlandica]|nr:hypothetical protein BGZ57DRAFT_595671 [Hyaloscypha finlandica]
MCERYSTEYSTVADRDIRVAHCRSILASIGDTGSACRNSRLLPPPPTTHLRGTGEDRGHRHLRLRGSRFEVRDSRSLGQQAVVIRGAAQRATHQSSLPLFPPCTIIATSYPSSLISNCMPRAAGLASDQQLPVDADVPCDWTGGFEGFHRPDTHGILAPLRQTRDGEMRIRIRIRACSPQSVRGQRQNLQRHADGIGRCMLPSLKNGASEETRSGRGPRGMAVSTVFISQCLSAL